jgi:hypothetical protein
VTTEVNPASVANCEVEKVKCSSNTVSTPRSRLVNHRCAAPTAPGETRGLPAPTDMLTTAWISNRL